MKFSRIFSLQALLILLLSEAIVYTQCDEQATRRLPSIWMKEGGELDYYRIRAELELLSVSKSFVIEEWASTLRQAFRLDLTKSPGDIRTTFLANKQKGEKFLYQPFTCTTLKDKPSQNLGAAISDDFSGMFPSDSSNSLMPVGIGSLWLHALKYDCEFAPASDEESSLRSKPSAHVLKRYDRYTMQAGGENPFSSVFYFHPKSSLVTSESNLKSLAMIEVQDSSKRVIMRIRMLEAEENWQNDFRSINSLDVFDLPTGYGCQRASQFEIPFNTKPQPGESFLLQLEITSMQPGDLEHDFAQWKSHSVSARFLMGHFEMDYHQERDRSKQKRNSYLVMETQDYMPDDMSPKMYGSELRLATVRRLRRVWDLGVTLSDDDAESSGRDQIRYYELDLLSGQCKMQCDLSSNTFIDLTNKADSDKQDKPAPLDQVSLDTKLLQQFLFDQSGFHLIKEVGPKERELVYERRFELLELRNQLGELIWEGPVSVARFHIQDPIGQEIETTAVVYFLSKDRTRLVGKLQVRASPKRPISAAYLHQSLDVNSCFSALFDGPHDGATGGRQMRRQALNKGINFAITYSIEPQELAEEASYSEEFEESIYENLLKSMWSISDKQLDLLQVVDVDVDFDSSQSVAKVTARLLEKPSLLSYIVETNLNFASPSPPGATIITELKATEEACAESCQHYGCPMFVYCRKTKFCDLLVGEYKRKSNSGMDSSLLHGDANCNLFKARSGHEEPSRRINVAHLLHQMQSSILNLDEKQDEQIDQLKLNIDLIRDGVDKVTVELNPIKLETGASLLDDTDELSQTMDSISGKQLDLSNSLDEDQQVVHAEYVLMFKNRKYKKLVQADTNLFPVQEASHKTYGQCEALCEQSDCKSFSYCQLEQTCQVSQLHESSLIEGHLDQEDLCFVMTRDYLSKFERINEIDKLQNRPSIESIKVANSRDCAVRCMEEQQFKCLSFLFCSISGAPVGQVDTFDGFDCYLKRNHAPTIQSDPVSRKSTPTRDEAGGNINLRTTCELYTRSFLSEFDKYYGKALPKTSETGQVLDSIELKGFGSEFCASKCVELTDGGCGAFQACIEEDSHGTSCSLLKTNYAKRDLLDNLISNKRCTTFITSQNTPPSDQVDDESAQSDAPREAPEEQTSHWLTIIILIIVGLVVGYGLAMKFVPRYQ